MQEQHGNASRPSRLTGLGKLLIAGIVLTAGAVALHTWPQRFGRPSYWVGRNPDVIITSVEVPKVPRPGERPVTIAIAQTPGLAPLVVGAGGLTTQPGSAAANEGLALSIVLIEDDAARSEALRAGKADVVPLYIDALPLALPSWQAAGVDVRAFLHASWSRGADACVAAPEVRKVEDLVGRKVATQRFAPAHTLLEFLVSNSRLSPAETAELRETIVFGNDPAAVRTAFSTAEVDVACLPEPEAIAALAARTGARRLFSTAHADELLGEVLLARKDFLEQYPELASKLGRVWLAGVKAIDADAAASARLLAASAPRFAQLGAPATQDWFQAVRRGDLGENVRLFGLDGDSAAFDRVYAEAENIWMQYPQAGIKARTPPAELRDQRVVQALWEAEGRPLTVRALRYHPSVAATGAPLFSKPISIRFAMGKSELLAETVALVNKRVLPQLQMARGMYVRVEGNTDALGDEEDNQSLSEKRAQAVVNYLVSRGVDAARIAARGNGSGKPMASNKTVEGRARNRRTEILFIPAPASS